MPADNEDAQELIRLLTMNLLPTSNLIAALSRNAVEWLYDPRTRQSVLRARSGRLYSARFIGRGWWLTERQNDNTTH